MNPPRRRRPVWAWRWPAIRWIHEELRNGAWVELSTDEMIEEAYEAAREVLEQPNTTAQKKAAWDAVLKHYANTVEKLDD